MRLTVSVHALSQPLDGADLFIKLKHQKCSKTQAISNQKCSKLNKLSFCKQTELRSPAQ